MTKTYTQILKQIETLKAEAEKLRTDLEQEAHHVGVGATV